MIEILLNYPGADVRLYFRLYFFFFSILIGVFGQKCVTSRAKLKLLQGQRVKLHLMSNWLSHFDPVMMAATFKALPGGWLWYIMFLAFLLNSASDFVTTFVQQSYVQDRCIFGTGMVVQSNPQPVSPPFNGKPYAVATQAQAISLANGGLQGIYDKVNGNLNFSADANDILGQWNCVANSKTLQYPWNATVDEVIINLQQQQLIYENTGYPIYATSELDGGVSHLVIWGTSAGNTNYTQFDVQVSIDTTALGTDPKIMQSFECKLNDTSGRLVHIQTLIPSHATLMQGVQYLQGAIYNGWRTPASNNTGEIIEQVLNAIILVAGGQNYLLDDSAKDQKQGCVTRRTYVPWTVVALAAGVAVLTLFLLLFWTICDVRFRFLARQRMGERTEVNYIKKYAPGNIAEWMAQAVEEHRGRGNTDTGLARNEPVEAHDVKKWLYGRQGNSYGIVGRVDATFADSVPLMESGWRAGNADGVDFVQNVRGKLTP